MLQHLEIENFAIIDQQTIIFESGLNVISGETGTGKSIILRALELILGGRSRNIDVRSGANQFELSALFDISGISDQERESLPDIVSGEELVIARSGTGQGKSRIYLNGRLASLATLQEVSSRLMSICGQSEYVRLLDPAKHLLFVDALSEAVKNIKDEYRVAFNKLVVARERLIKSKALFMQATEMKEVLSHRIEEIGRLAPKAGMRADLEHTVERLSKGERLLEVGHLLADFLDNSRQGVLESLRRALMQAEALVKLDGGLAGIRDSIGSCFAEATEVSNQLARVLSDIDIDDRSLNIARDNLADLARLERKYHTDDGGLASLLKEAKTRLGDLPDEVSLIEQEKEAELLLAKVLELGSQLSEARATAARTVEEAIASDLAELGMPEANVVLRLERLGEPHLGGLDRGEFLLERRGVALPLRSIASGGELSRLTLVLKKILRDTGGINVLVFDEVDTGVSGSVARSVGKMLRSLASTSQVICITHLPQVASLAQHHLLVEKSATGTNGTNGKTVTTVRALSNQERIDEVARMIAGTRITDASRESARELISSEC